MKSVVHILSILALCLGLAGPATAAVIGTYTHDYGITTGLVAPSAFGKLKGKHVEVGSDGSGSSDFRDFIDISGIGSAVTVDSIELTIMFDNAGPKTKKSENWFVEISGAGSGFGLNTFALLEDGQAPQSVTLLPGTDAFDAALANLGVEFTFTDRDTSRTDTFKLYSATVRINGSVVAAVPLPAPGFLLLAGLSGLAFLRQRGGAAKGNKPPQT